MPGGGHTHGSWIFGRIRAAVAGRRNNAGLSGATKYLRDSIHGAGLCGSDDSGGSWAAGLFDGLARRGTAARRGHPERPNGGVIGNEAIVPAGTAAGGPISVYASNNTDLVIDINGYFAPAGSPGALNFYPLTPCRVADTRAGSGFSGSFGPPSLVGGATRDFPCHPARAVSRIRAGLLVEHDGGGSFRRRIRILDSISRPDRHCRLRQR